MGRKCILRLCACIPGPMPTPVLSPEVMFVIGSLDRTVGDWTGGEIGAGGGGIVSLARREDEEAIRRGLRGEGGREFRSGAIIPNIKMYANSYSFPVGIDSRGHDCRGSSI